MAAGLYAAGLYLERVSDCMACHSRQGGAPFAGGRAIGTPFGVLYSTNITPDRDTGIGTWTDDQFYAALHDGIGHGLGYLYPVMPDTSYTKTTREDVLAIKAYLFSLRPVFSPRPPNGLSFPFDIRASLFFWRELFFTPGTFVPNPARSAAWNRGAYLVEGPGHCGECHSPRDVLGATETGASLSGGQVQQWVAPNISSDPLSGIGDRSVADIVTFLHKGADKPLGEAFGPMGEVVHDADVADVANYVRVSWGNKASPDTSPQLVASVRALSPVGIAGSDAAREFDCPKVGGATVPGALIDPADAQLFAGPGDAGNRIREVLHQLRQQQPKPTDGSLVNSMIAALCPAVANATGMNNQEKRARLMQLSRIVLEDVSGHR